jgi:hypothetical protein
MIAFQFVLALIIALLIFVALQIGVERSLIWGFRIVMFCIFIFFGGFIGFALFTSYYAVKMLLGHAHN